MDYTSLVSAVDFTSAITALGSVFGALVLVRVAIAGARKVVGAIR
jgi:hypothetical protein